ncbi:MAG: ORF6N domain-containing protein [Elusimicrobia bacterium]|nr:ORF6N domain-containing protein [Elusimicrobiota bacterium]
MGLPTGPEGIERRILLIRGFRVMLDADLAAVYGVTTKRLNEQVKRNQHRFPTDFMLRLTAKEKAEVVAKCDHLYRLKFSPTLPAAFTEHGAVMLACVLNSPSAVDASINVVRAFIRLREMLGAHKDLARRLDAIEKRYDSQFKTVFDAIRGLMAPPKEPLRRIGFQQ